MIYEYIDSSFARNHLSHQLFLLIGEDDVAPECWF